MGNNSIMQRFFKTQPAREREREREQSSPPTEDSLFVNDESDHEITSEISSDPSTISRTSPEKSIPQELFESQITNTIGHVPSRSLRYLYEKYKHDSKNVRHAINEYLNGINPEDIDNLLQDSTTTTTTKRPLSSLDLNSQLELVHNQMSTISNTIQKNNINNIEQSNDEWTRFIGSLDVQAWATRPTMKPLNYAEKLQLKRLIPKNSTIANSSIIRLCTIGEYNREIGRIPEDLTRILSPLFDLNIAKFETTILESTKRRLSTGDSFIIQIDIFLKSTAFELHDELELNLSTQDTHPAKKLKMNFNFSTESAGEATLRLRQFALSKLFERLHIRPLRISTNVNSNNDIEYSEEDLTQTQTQTQESSNSNSSQPITVNLDSDEEDIDQVAIQPVDEVNLDQLKQFYQQNNQSNLLNNLPESTMPPSTNFKLDLRPYQKVGLSWMILREGETSVLQELSNDSNFDVKDYTDDGIMNPLWRKYRWPKNNNNNINNDTIDYPYFYANMYNGELSLEKPIIKASRKGGILSDEMGLGKTISALALINSVPYDTSYRPPSTISKTPYASKTTLIVVPMSLLTQWKSEFDKVNNNPNHYCHIYYGNSTDSHLSSTLINHSSKHIPIVVLTTYGTIQNEYIKMMKRESSSRASRVGIYSVSYFRIILDEGHNIRNRNTKTAKSIYELECSRRWILTGTPIVNRLDDLYSLIKFLQLDPWSNFSYWKTFITLPFEQKKISQALDIIKSILDPIFLRRTKNMRGNDGKPLVELPEKQVIIEEIKFNEKEAKLYNWLKTKAHNTFSEGLKSGQLLKQYTQILAHILRLRQVCCHMDLVGGPNEMDMEEAEAAEEAPDDDTKKFVKDVTEQKVGFLNDTEVRQAMYKLYDKVNLEDSECSICTQSPISIGEMVITPCGHTFCMTCLIEHIEFQEKQDNTIDNRCPNCRTIISKYKLFRLRNKVTSSKDVRFHTATQKSMLIDDNYDKNEDLSKNYTFQLYLYNPDKTSSKIQALFNHLRILRDQSPGQKVIVFSQFSSYLDIIENELKLQLGEAEFFILKFDGRLSMNERERVLQKFNDNSTYPRTTILLLSLKAGGVGLNLTQASRAYMMDPWWSPSIEDQAIDRIHRIGQNETVKVVRFIMENSIEIKMLKIQERKKQIGEAVGVEEEERRKRRIEDIKMLFEE
ncbi:ATPase/DNA helicase [Scheffersomyces amazonensis]|uniref:ATPase/DNA helicase n=1 Tax=Scheffersomyces amazonensis TaxID=1078765 RepID=UPI00315D16D7